MHKILNHKITLIVSVVAAFIAVVAGIYVFIPTKKALLTADVARKDIVESVSVSGKIDSDKHVALSFGKSGTVSSISIAVGDKVKAGQVMASMKADDLRASLLGAQADVAVQQANLSALLKGTRSEQVAIYAQSVDTTKLGLETAVKDSYLKAVDALRNKVDIVFTDGGTVNPQLRIRTQNDTIKKSIEDNRVAATQKLSNWMGDVTSARSTLNFIKTLIDAIASQVNVLTQQNSGYAQDMIDSFVSATNAASIEVNGAITALNGADQAYKTSSDQLSLVQASSTPDALIAQQALVAKNEATVANIRSQIANTLLVAPFDGVVASVVPKVGQDIVAYAPAIDLISDGAYKIEVEIPESDIAKVAVGNNASVSLDAYGSSKIIAAHVSSIDLSQTVENGAGFYKATITLDQMDNRVRTDMTGRVLIDGRKAVGVISVPSSAVIKKERGLFVLKEESDGSFIQTKVETGISGNNLTEIVSGLSSGDKVASFGNAN